MRKPAGLTQSLADNHNRRNRHVNRTGFLIHRNQQPGICRFMNALRHAGTFPPHQNNVIVLKLKIVIRLAGMRR